MVIKYPWNQPQFIKIYLYQTIENTGDYPSGVDLLLRGGVNELLPIFSIVPTQADSFIVS